jgi:hypothetical protein
MTPIALPDLQDSAVVQAAQKFVNGVTGNGTAADAAGKQKQAQQHPDHQNHGFATRALHVGSEPSAETGAVIPAISLSTTFAQDGVGGIKVSLSSLVSHSLRVLLTFTLATRASNTRALEIPTATHSSAPLHP